MSSALMFLSVLLELIIPGTNVGSAKLTERLQPHQTPAEVKVTINSQPVKISPVRDILAAGGIVQDMDSSAVLLSKKADTRLPIASITKLMVAVVIVKNHKLDEIVTAPETNIHPLVTKMGLKKGDKLTVSELLHGLLIPSGADAAIALAVFHSGSTDKFVEEMNAEANALGMKNTNFNNVTGEDATGAYGTPSDLIGLGRVALTSPTIKSIVAKRSYTAKSVEGKSYKLLNTNEILDGKFILGIKTGFTFGAGQCLLAYATKGGHTVISVVLNSSDRFGESYNLLSGAFKSFGW